MSSINDLTPEQRERIRRAFMKSISGLDQARAEMDALFRDVGISQASAIILGAFERMQSSTDIRTRGEYTFALVGMADTFERVFGDELTEIVK